MTVPAILFGTLVATLFGAAFHLWKGEGLGRLILYILLGWLGFWAGHIIAGQLDLRFLDIGPLHFGPAVVISLVTIGVGYWFSLVRKDIH